MPCFKGFIDDDNKQIIIDVYIKETNLKNNNKKMIL